MSSFLGVESRRDAAGPWPAVWAWLERVSDRQLLAFTVGWVIVGGLVLQLLVLPYVFPSAHWGHGIIADQDSAIYHQLAVEGAERIRQQGWGAWELRPSDHVVPGIASVFYRLLAPEPWTMLPVNGILFALAVVSVRRLLTILFDSPAAALVATSPFFLFPSFVPIWGQLQKDVFTGAGLALVLSAVIVAGYEQERRLRLVTLVLVALAGMGLVWLARPYGTTLVGGGVVAAALLGLVSRRCRRARLATVAAVVILAAAAGVQPWRTRELPPEPPPPAPVSAPAVAGAKPPTVVGPAPAVTPEVRPGPAGAGAGGSAARDSAGAARSPAGQSAPRAEAVPAELTPTVPAGRAVSAPPAVASSETERWWRLPDVRLPRISLPELRLPRLRRIDPAAQAYGACAPYPSEQLLDKALFSLCTVREGFIGDARRRYAGSAIDYEIRLRSMEDFVAYVPRALSVAFLEPYPMRWSAEKKSPIGRLGSLFVPFEMAAAYLSFAAVVLFAWHRLRRLELWAIVAFCAFYNLTFAYTMPQLGTVYRMRAFAFAIVVSTALAVALSRRLPATRGDAASG